MNLITHHPDENNICLETIQEKEKFLDPALKKKTHENKHKSKTSLDNICAKCAYALEGQQEVRQAALASPGKGQEAEFKSTLNPLLTKRITIAGGFLDIALFSANCEQLKFVLELGSFHIYYKVVLSLIITSLVLQLLVGLTLFLTGCHVIRKASDETYSNYLNHITMGLVAVITIINIFISTFGPKGTVMARCLGAFSYANSAGPSWTSFVNFTRHYMVDGL